VLPPKGGKSPLLLSAAESDTAGVSRWICKRRSEGKELCCQRKKGVDTGLSALGRWGRPAGVVGCGKEKREELRLGLLLCCAAVTAGAAKAVLVAALGVQGACARPRRKTAWWGVDLGCAATIKEGSLLRWTAMVAARGHWPARDAAWVAVVLVRQEGLPSMEGARRSASKSGLCTRLLVVHGREEGGKLSCDVLSLPWLWSSGLSLVLGACAVPEGGCCCWIKGRLWWKRWGD